MRQRPDPVAQRGRAFELQLFRRRLHFGRELALHGRHLAGEEILRLGHQPRVIRSRNPPHAGRRAAFYLVQQAGAGAVGEHRVGAGSQQEQPLHGIHRLVHRPGAGEGPPIAAGAGLRAPVLAHLRKRMVFRQHQPRIGFVVPQHDVVARLQPLDQVGFQQQRFRLGMGGHDLHGGRVHHHPPQPLLQPVDLRVVRHPFAQGAGLADVQRLALRIQHTVDAGGERQRCQHALDHRKARAQWRGVQRRCWINRGLAVRISNTAGGNGYVCHGAGTGKPGPGLPGTQVC